MDDGPAQFRVCVFCGSRAGTKPDYREAARAVGAELARLGLGLVYGGGAIGLMGAVADAALDGGGTVIGIIPEALTRKEIAHERLTELIVVPDMHQRKAQMASLSRAFLTLPGGVGTYEEFFEILTWSVLGLHAKPIGLLNVAGYFDPLLSLLQHAVDEGFMKAADLQHILVSSDPAELLERLPRYQPPVLTPRWIDQDQT